MKAAGDDMPRVIHYMRIEWTGSNLRLVCHESDAVAIPSPYLGCTDGRFRIPYIIDALCC